MANRRRGEVDVVLAGERYTLCLTLGALAELEDAFGAGDLAGLGARFETGRLSAGDLAKLLGAGLRGGGHRLSDDEVAALPIAGGLGAMAHAVAALLQATFGDAAPNPPGPQAA